jgi:integrase
MSIYKPKLSPYYHYDFQVRGRRFYGSTGTGDRRKAESIERAERERAGAVRRSVADIPHTFGEAITRFWHEARQHDATGDDTLRNLIWLGNAIGEHTPIVDVDGNLLHRIVARRRGERAKNSDRFVSNATVNRTVIEPLRRLVVRAKEWGVQFPNEPKGKDYRLREPRERVRELRVEESNRIDVAMRDDYAPFFALARATGMRLNECLLKWSEVDWCARRIVKTGKDGNPVKVPITSAVREILWPLRGHHPVYVFTYVARRTREGRKGGDRYPVTYNGVKTMWRRLRKRAGVQDFRFHDFRHDFATKLLRKTGNLKIVQRALNHAEIQSTARYAHVGDKELAEAFETLHESRNKSRNKVSKAS